MFKQKRKHVVRGWTQVHIMCVVLNVQWYTNLAYAGHEDEMISSQNLYFQITGTIMVVDAQLLFKITFKFKILELISQWSHL